MRVAVIGAGFSGMLAAYLLEKAGTEVTIYEKEEHIGGHCRTLFSKGVYTDIGTVFSFSNKIKELLIELKVDYSEVFIYKNYVNECYQPTEMMSQNEVQLLLEELNKLSKLLLPHKTYLEGVRFDFVPEELLVTFNSYANHHQLEQITKIITPLLSSFGLGNINHIQAYYVFKIFSLDILYAFIKGDKLLSLNKGMSNLISRLSENISDIRYSLEVINVEVVNKKVKIESPYGHDYFDKVLITTKLPKDVIKDTLYNTLMKKIETNPFISAVYEVHNKHLPTTYFKSNFGQNGKIQFFYTKRQSARTTLVAYTYGKISKSAIDGMTDELANVGVDIKQLITVKQWYIFPHLKARDLTSHFYTDINTHQKTNPVCLIGSLVTEPSLDKLYVSVKECVNDIIQYDRDNK
ncbi:MULTISPECIES: FAD-dependent oxidoreductase [unclassified Fusibacter]|uniref:FAD-dependent oxidoreductase n=1 Tax=unclassified Fusibacter TaxID=2624464 RepID=UPI0010105650|nr:MULTISPECIES: FAD-dependent oxidoreductase [unclassified Fusibacter]MCK8060737.1 FAD-dependent oxidoreductase [Fusibacter sp. A2]NPE23033.1 NAD(P)-binding protein [Fusibacter sp. A1]RXV59706.1 FAD-dependent oxidoreductase [Fusibacter sp. A1]